MNHETLLDIAKFVAETVKEPWVPRGEPIYLYHNEHSRLVVQPETSSNHEGLWRHDRLADHGIYDAELDGETLGRTFVGEVCQHLSINDMRYIRDHIARHIDAWEAEHEPSPR